MIAVDANTATPSQKSADPEACITCVPVSEGSYAPLPVPVAAPATAVKVAAPVPAAVKEAAERVVKSSISASAQPAPAPAAANNVTAPRPAVKRSIEAAVQEAGAALLLASIIYAFRLVNKAGAIGSAVSTPVWSVSVFACAIAVQACTAARPCFEAVQHRCRSFYSQALTQRSLWYLHIARFGVWLLFMAAFSLCLAASMTLPSLAVDYVISGIITSWPTALVVSFKVIQVLLPAFSCCSNLCTPCFLMLQHFAAVFAYSLPCHVAELCSKEQPRAKPIHHVFLVCNVGLVFIGSATADRHVAAK